MDNSDNDGNNNMLSFKNCLAMKMKGCIGY